MVADALVMEAVVADVINKEKVAREGGFIPCLLYPIYLINKFM